MKILPVAFVWDGRAMVPNTRYGNLCARQYDVGSEYVLEPISDRNMKFHKGYFATLHKMFMNLPERTGKRFPSDEHLRHWALVQTHHCTERVIPCETKKLAKQIAVIARGFSEYAVIKIVEQNVFVWEAKSQRVGGGMKADEFKQSCDDVLALVVSMIPGTTIEDFWKSAERDD